jgi:riboflavin kinase / FMN adenylyltransferase
MTQVEEELARHSPEKDTVLTVGVFDGVHLGHKHLLAKLKGQARQRNMLSGVVTFQQHPEDVLSPRPTLPFLTDSDEKTTLLKNEGIDFVVTLSFNRELSRLSARHFLSLLQQYLRLRGLVVGPDFALGRDKDGNIDNLKTLGQEMGFMVTIASPAKINGEVVSSTAIRQALADGDMDKVQRLIGHAFNFKGTVISGDHRGAGLGFPTANLEADIKRALPTDGVYATHIHIGGKTYDAMTNIGTRPTFGRGKRLIEIFILDYNGNLYGQEVTVDFIQRLRDEKEFHSAEELKKQIAEDIKKGRDILARARS